jgi:hypothetical protein
MIQNYVVSGLLALASLYFLVNEFKQLKSSGFGYFTSFWNYLDWIPALIIPVLLVSDLTQVYIPFVVSLSSITSLLLCVLIAFRMDYK